jgi:hypothetical protein
MGDIVDKVLGEWGSVASCTCGSRKALRRHELSNEYLLWKKKTAAVGACF